MTTVTTTTTREVQHQEGDSGPAIIGDQENMNDNNNHEENNDIVAESDHNDETTELHSDETTTEQGSTSSRDNGSPEDENENDNHHDENDDGTPWFIYHGGTMQENALLREQTHIRIHPTVTEIPDQAFCASPSLTHVHVPVNAALGVIGYQAFYKCQSLTTVVIDNDGHNDNNHNKDNKTTTTTSPWTSIGHGAFGDCPVLQEFQVPLGIRRIEAYTFAYCRALQSIRLPETVTYLCNSSLAYCSALTHLTLPSSTLLSTSGNSGNSDVGNATPFLRLGKHAVAHCTSLTHIQFPASGRRVVIGQEILTGCTSLQSLEFSTLRNQNTTHPGVNDNGQVKCTVVNRNNPDQTPESEHNILALELLFVEQCSRFRSTPLEQRLGIPSESSIKPTCVYTFLRQNLWRLPMGLPNGSIVGATSRKEDTGMELALMRRSKRNRSQTNRRQRSTHGRQDDTQQSPRPSSRNHRLQWRFFLMSCCCRSVSSSADE